MASLADFSAMWRADIDADPHHRDEAADLAFWNDHATVYDQQGGLPAASEATTQALTELIPPGAAVVDIGGGTGRFAIPLAAAGRAVTIVDASPATLAVARCKAQACGAELTLVQQSWPTELDSRFDVALAAWSLYRQRRLDLALAAMLAHVRREVIVAESTGLPTALDTAIAVARNEPVRARQARHLLVAGAFAQLGVGADVRLVTERRPVTRSQVIRLLGDGNPDQRACAQECLDAACARTDDGWQVTSVIGLVCARLDSNSL